MQGKALVALDAYDFQFSLGVLPYAASIAKGLEMPLLLASVVDPDRLEIPEGLKYQAGDPDREVEPGAAGILLGTSTSPAMPVPGEEERPSYPHPGREPQAVQIIENAKFEVRRHLVSVATALRTEGTPADIVVSADYEPAQELVRVAEREGCGLMAMATHKRGALQQLFGDSTTRAVLEQARLPVLVVMPESTEGQPTERVAISHVIVPLDGSPFAEGALPYAADIAKGLEAELVLVRVTEGRQTGPASTTATAGQPASTDAGRYLQTVAGRLESSGLRVRREVLSHDVEDELARLSRSTPNSLVVLASHRRSGVSRLISGSVADALVRSTGGPVVIVPPQAAGSQ